MKKLIFAVAAAFLSLSAYAQDNFNPTPKDGNERVILHAWCWSFNSIRENMEKIAQAGFTTIQTSPAQLCVTQTKGDKGGGNQLPVQGRELLLERHLYTFMNRCLSQGCFFTAPFSGKERVRYHINLNFQ